MLLLKLLLRWVHAHVDAKKQVIRFDYKAEIISQLFRLCDLNLTSLISTFKIHNHSRRSSTSLHAAEKDKALDWSL